MSSKIVNKLFGICIQKFLSKYSIMSHDETFDKTIKKQMVDEFIQLYSTDKVNINDNISNVNTVEIKRKQNDLELDHSTNIFRKELINRSGYDHDNSDNKNIDDNIEDSLNNLWLSQLSSKGKGLVDLQLNHEATQLKLFTPVLQISLIDQQETTLSIGVSDRTVKTETQL